MSDLISWDLVLQPPGTEPSWIRDEDLIAGTAWYDGSSPGIATFSLGTSNDHVRWWKALRVVGGNGHGEPDEGRVLGSEVAFQDDVRNAPALYVIEEELAGAFLQIGKAKFLGVHTYMYHLPLDARPGDAALPGAHISFDWLRDNGVGNP